MLPKGGNKFSFREDHFSERKPNHLGSVTSLESVSVSLEDVVVELNFELLSTPQSQCLSRSTLWKVMGWPNAFKWTAQRYHNQVLAVTNSLVYA